MLQFWCTARRYAAHTVCVCAVDSTKPAERGMHWPSASRSLLLLLLSTGGHFDASSGNFDSLFRRATLTYMRALSYQPAPLPSALLASNGLVCFALPALSGLHGPDQSIPQYLWILGCDPFFLRPHRAPSSTHTFSTTVSLLSRRTPRSPDCLGV